MESDSAFTIARALVKLKMLEKRIEKQTAQLRPVAVKTGVNLETGIKSEEEFVKDASADYQSVVDLMEHKRKIKAAIVKSNAVTEVEVAGKKMTVAEAIERKGAIKHEKALLATLKEKYSVKLAEVERSNKLMQEKLMKLLEATYAKRESQLSKDDYNRIAQPFIDNNEAKLIDPLDLDKKIQALEKSIEEFSADVDVVLSVSNARTTISI